MSKEVSFWAGRGGSNRKRSECSGKEDCAESLISRTEEKRGPGGDWPRPFDVLCRRV